MFTNQNFTIFRQCIICLALVITVSSGCYAFADFIDYRITALILFLIVSITAVLFDIIPVLLTAFLSGLLLNFFFIKPLFTLHIKSTEDVLLFFIYLIIALVNTVLTFKIKKAETKARDKEEREKTIKLYDTLLNSLSHELRTPIAIIIGAVDALKAVEVKLSVSSQIELFEEIDKASVRLNTQVDNLLNMSRLETGMLLLKRDWCDLNELIYGLIQKAIPLKTKQVIHFNSNEKLPLFKLDAGLIIQIIQNLLSNAILYTPENTKITIEVAYLNDSCIITISDNGAGFPETEIDYIFDKFYRVSNTKTGGSGLGLSIVKGFVEAHDGTITASNVVPNGASFTIYIPAETSFLKNLKNE